MNVRVIFFNELRFLRVLIISTFLKKSFFFYSAPPNVEFTFNFQSKFRNGARVLNIRFHNRIIINTSVIRETVILMPVRIQRNSKKKKKNSSSFERNSRRKLRREISMRFKGSHFSGSFSQLEEIKWPKRERLKAFSCHVYSTAKFCKQVSVCRLRLVCFYPSTNLIAKKLRRILRSFLLP